MTGDIAALRRALARLGLDVRGDASSWAALSPCGLYRYALGRSWQTPMFVNPVMLFILHNPSTADANEDDPTLRRCIGFAKREGCGEVILVNRFAWRSTDKAALVPLSDPVGRLNAPAVSLAMKAADCIVYAWGKVDPRIDYVPAWERCGLTMHCLGKNGDGSPKHPLYLADATPLVRWS